MAEAPDPLRPLQQSTLDDAAFWQGKAKELHVRDEIEYRGMEPPVHSVSK